MPNPFRHYEGVPALDLPANPPGPETPALEVLCGVSGRTPAREGATFLWKAGMSGTSWRISIRAARPSAADRVRFEIAENVHRDVRTDSSSSTIRIEA
jgi:hypothetical protein